MDLKLKGRKAIITGGSKGIGRAIADMLAEEGCHVGICARNAGDLKTAEEHYRQALTIRPRFAEALYQMADLEFHNKSYLSARGFIERFLEVSKSSPSSLWLAVRIEQGLGNKTAASNYGQRLKLEHPQSPEAKQFIESERQTG